MGLDRPFRKTRSDLPVRQNQYDPAQCRPGERRDPYAAASLFGKVANGFCSNKRRWLWVPAFAGTTLESVARVDIPTTAVGSLSPCGRGRACTTKLNFTNGNLPLPWLSKPKRRQCRAF